MSKNADKRTEIKTVNLLRGISKTRMFSKDVKVCFNDVFILNKLKCIKSVKVTKITTLS